MRGRRSRALLLGAALLVLAVLMQLGAGAATTGPATQPASGDASGAKGAASGKTGRLGRADGNGLAGWGKLTRQTSEFGKTGATDPMWQMIGMVVVVAVLGIAAVWVFRRVGPRIQHRPGRNIAVMETAYLGPQKSVHLLRVGQKEFLVASTRERISMLADVTDSADSADADRPGEGRP